MIDQIVQVIKRSKIEWHNVRSIAESSMEDFPHSGSKFIRAHLDQLADDAIELGQENTSGLYADTSDVECSIYTYRNARQKPLVDLLDSHDFYELEVFAKNNPKAFLDEIWPWFINMMAHHIYEDDYSQRSSVYRGKFCFHIGAYPGKLIEAFIVSIVELAQNHRADFLLFLNKNSQSDHLIIHKLLFYGLEKIADKEPKTVLNYLLSDSRRLCLGSGTSEHHSKTKKLIAAVCPHLSSKSRQQLEDAILSVNYSQPWEGCDAENRAAVLRWNRQHRLQLLLAFPEECLSRRAKQLRQEESRAFPWEISRNEHTSQTIAQDVGPRMTKEEMSCAEDDHLLSLFDVISDTTDPNYFREKLTRSGGVIQQSREFGNLVKENSARFFQLLPSMKPKQHESYVGESIKALSEIDFSAASLIQLTENLHSKGYSSEDFRSTVANALEKVAEKNHGLPPSSLSMLESWLANHSKPELDWYKNEAHRHSSPLRPIVFGTTSSHSLASGRGAIVRAIAAGYLNQTPPDLQGWEKFVKTQLDVEKHPVVWVDILWRMPVLLNLDRAKATGLFDSIIQSFPEVLLYEWLLYRISRVMGWLEPKSTIRSWLEILKGNDSVFSQQAYGELLLIYNFHCKDEWSKEIIRHHIQEQSNESVLCGLAHSANYFWINPQIRPIAAEILQSLATSSSRHVQKVVAGFFQYNRESFRADAKTIGIIQSVYQNPVILAEAASDLINIFADENLVDTRPNLVVEVLNELLCMDDDTTQSVEGIAWVADILTTIAIQLHRHPLYREEGLKIFERLLELNLSETKEALETLDRKPSRAYTYTRRRRRRNRQS